MRIDDLIGHLGKVRETHGNLQVRTMDEYECILCIGEPHIRTNDANAKPWATDEGLADGELYVII